MCDLAAQLHCSRVRPPPHFGMFLADAAGASCFSLHELAARLPSAACICRGTFASSWPAHQTGPFPSWQLCMVRMACPAMHQPRGWQSCLLRDAAGGPAAPSWSACLFPVLGSPEAAVQQTLLSIKAISVNKHSWLISLIRKTHSLGSFFSTMQARDTTWAFQSSLMCRLLDPSHNCHCLQPAPAAASSALSSHKQGRDNFAPWSNTVMHKRTLPSC